MNILIVGLGSIAVKHINVLRSLFGSTIHLYALRSGNSQETYPGINDFKSYDEIDVDIDFAIVSNPTSEHFNTINTLLNKPIPLFIEKPIVHKMEQAEKLLKRIVSHDVFTYVACNLRFHPCIKFLKNYLTEDIKDTINEVNIYAGSYLPDWRPGKDYKRSYSSISTMGGGVHLDLFHEFDYVFWLFGNPDTVSSIKRSESSINIDAVDYANYCLEYPRFAVSVILNYYRRKAKRQIELVFEEKILTVDLIGCIITDDNGTVIFSESTYSILDTYTEQMKYFSEHLIQKRPPMNTFAESVQILKICLNNE